jgi:WD40 repeat protein
MQNGPPAVDALGDPLPAGAVARLGTVRQWSPEGINAVAVTHDGKLLATSTFRGRIRFWNAADGKLVREAGQERVKVPGVQDPNYLVEHIQFSPDSKWLATLEQIMVVRVWEVATGKELFTVPAPKDTVIRSFTFAPEGDKLVLAGYRGDLVVWDLAAKKVDRVLKGHFSDVLALTFSADGKYLVSGGFDQTVRRWEWQAKQPTGEVLGKHNAYVIGVAASGDGKRVASCGQDPSVRLWDAADKKEIRLIDFIKERFTVAMSPHVWLSPDGKQLIVGGRSEVGRWEVDSGKRLGVPRSWFGTAAVTPDGKWLAVGIDRVRLWDVTATKVVTNFAGQDQLPAVAALSPDGSVAATATTTYRDVLLWDARTGKLLRTFEGPESGPVWMLFSADGRTLYVAGRTGPGRVIGRWDVANGKQLEPLDADDTVRRLHAAMAPDGKSLAALDNGGGLRVYGLLAGKERFRSRLLDEKQPFPGPVVSFLPGGDQVAVATVKDVKNLHVMSVAFYDAKDGKFLREWSCPTFKLPFTSLFPEDVLAPSPTGRSLVMAQESGAIHIWTFHTRELLDLPSVSYFVPQTRTERQGVRHVSAVHSPDGRLLAVVGPGSTVSVREVASGGERLRLAADQGALHALTFSGDSTRLLSLGSDTTALVWDLASVKAGPALPAARLEALWEELGSADAAVAFKALRALLTSPAQAVALVKQRVAPAPVVTAAQVEQWLRDVGSDKYAVRQKATADLEYAGALAGPALRKALDGKPALESEQRMRKLLNAVEAGRAPGARLRQLRAVEILERIHSPVARQWLDALAGGMEGDLLTQEARLARMRLNAGKT